MLNGDEEDSRKEIEDAIREARRVMMIVVTLLFLLLGIAIIIEMLTEDYMDNKIAIIILAVMLAMYPITMAWLHLDFHYDSERLRLGAPPGVYERGLQYTLDLFVPYEEIKGYWRGKRVTRREEDRFLILKPRYGLKGRAKRKYSTMRVWESGLGEDGFQLLLARIRGHANELRDPPRLFVYGLSRR